VGHAPRRAVRVDRLLEAEYWASSPPISARVQDLSAEGVFLETPHPPAVGTVIGLRFELPDGGDAPVRARGLVRHTDPMVGVGIELVELPDATRERLRMFVASVLFGVENWRVDEHDPEGPGDRPR